MQVKHRINNSNSTNYKQKGQKGQKGHLLIVPFINQFKPMESIEIKLPVINPQTTDSTIPDEIISEFKKGCEIVIWDDPHDWSINGEEYAFHLWLQYAEGNAQIMFDIELDKLEMFASSLLKRIEMIRRDYHDTIQQKITNQQPL